MIVVDESLIDPIILDAIAAWYQGRVLSVRRLRPNTVIKDDALPLLLGRVSQPTFVTINVRDFWRKVRADPRYCVIAFDLAQDQSLTLPGVLRQLLRLFEFRTKAARMGKVIYVTPTNIEYYEADRQIHTLPWPK
jgi:hypothetical protein